MSSSSPCDIASSATAVASSGAGLLRHGIPDELDGEHRAEAADVTHLREALLPAEHALPNRVADDGCARDQALLVDHVEDGQRSRLGYRVADVRAPDCRVAGRVHDLRAAEHARERQSAGDRLRNDHEVRLDAVVLDGEHPARAAEARLHLVDDQQDAVLVAEAADARHELGRSNDEAAFALHRLDDDRRHMLGSDLGHECALERCERCARVWAAIVVRERDAVDLGGERAKAGLVRMRLRSERHGQQRAPVEAALEGDHGRPLRACARDLHGVLDRLGPGVEERGLRRRRDRRQGAEPLGELHVDLVRDDSEVGVREELRLLLDRGHDPRVRVAHREAADAAREVDEGVAVDVGERRATAFRRDDRHVDGEWLGDDPLLARQDLGGPRPGQRRHQLDGLRGRHGASISERSAALTGPFRPRPGASHSDCHCDCPS